MLHDIDYLQSGEKYYADYVAWREAGATPQGIALYFGLITRSALDALTHAILPHSNRNLFHFESKQSLPETHQFALRVKARNNICENALEDCDFVDQRLQQTVQEYESQSLDESMRTLINLYKVLRPDKFTKATNMVIVPTNSEIANKMLPSFEFEEQSSFDLGD